VQAKKKKNQGKRYGQETKPRGDWSVRGGSLIAPGGRRKGPRKVTSSAPAEMEQKIRGESVLIGEPTNLQGPPQKPRGPLDGSSAKKGEKAGWGTSGTN